MCVNVTDYDDHMYNCVSKPLGLTFQSYIILLTLNFCFVNNSMLNLKTTRDIKWCVSVEGKKMSLWHSLSFQLKWKAFLWL